MRARSTNVLSALACRVQFHSDKPVKWRPFLPPETFPPGTVRCSNRRMICEFAMDRLLPAAPIVLCSPAPPLNGLDRRSGII